MSVCRLVPSTSWGTGWLYSRIAMGRPRHVHGQIVDKYKYVPSLSLSVCISLSIVSPSRTLGYTSFRSPTLAFLGNFHLVLGLCTPCPSPRKLRVNTVSANSWTSTTATPTIQHHQEGGGAPRGAQEMGASTRATEVAVPVSIWVLTAWLRLK